LPLIVSRYVCCVINKAGDMAIHIAADSGKLDIVQYLIQKAGVAVDVRGWVS